MRDDVDARLTKAFRDVAVPEGLAERLLAGLAADSGADIPFCQAALGLPGEQESLPHRSRRWFFVSGGLAAAAATILLAVWLGGPASESVSEDSVRNEAIQLFNSGVKQPGYLLANGAPSNYPFSQQVLSIQGTKWRYLGGFLGSYSGVVYDLPGPPGARGALYVVVCNGVKQARAVARFATKCFHDRRFELLCVGLARGRIALRAGSGRRSVELRAVSEAA